MATATNSTINVETLVPDFYDPAAKQLLWTVGAIKTRDPRKNQENKQKNLDEAIAKRIKNFPSTAR